MRKFDYEREIKGTVLEGDPYFGSEKIVRATVPDGKMASYSDLVRYVLLHNYGGLWCFSPTLHRKCTHTISCTEGGIVL